jgi:CRP-like cAMP-binding protein
VTREHYLPGQEIIRENEAGAEMFILIQGTASVYRHTAEGELYRVTIFKGEEHVFFGEGALLDADLRSATIRADTECVCLVLGREAFAEFGKAHPAWAFPVLARIARAVMTRLRKTNQDLTLVYNALVNEIRGQ